jgi:hypothetical protein
MTSHSPPKDTLDGGKEREERLANLSGAMALARLTHQVKELELQKNQQEQLVKPTFSPINCVMYGFFMRMLMLAIPKSSFPLWSR